MVAACLLVLGVCAWGCTLVTDGLDVEDIAPSSSREAEFLAQRFEYFSWFPCEMMVPLIDYPHSQRALLDFETKLASLDKVVMVPPSWLDSFVKWVNTTATGLDSNVRGDGVAAMDIVCVASLT